MLAMSAFLYSCGGGGGGDSGGGNPQSNQAEITQLTVTIDGNYYLANLDGNIGTIIIPSSATIPNEVVVKSVTLSSGATGLSVGYTISLTNGSATIEITAQDGTTIQTYTIVVKKEIVVTTVPKNDETKDKRYHYVLFEIYSVNGANFGRHKLALKLSSEQAPTAQEMTYGDGVYRVIKGTKKRVLLAYTLNSGIKDYVEGTGDLKVTAAAKKHGDVLAAGTANEYTINTAKLLLEPNKSYTLYALEDGSTEVKNLQDFTTDEFDSNTSPWPAYYINDPAITGSYSYDSQDAVFIYPALMSVSDNNFVFAPKGKGNLSQ